MIGFQKAVVYSVAVSKPSISAPFTTMSWGRQKYFY